MSDTSTASSSSQAATGFPQPWRGTIDASLDLIDYLERQIATINVELKAGGADHPYVALLLTVPGIGWVLAFTIAAEIGDITRFPSAKKLTGYTGLCPRVYQSGERDRRGPLTKQGPKYLRWAMLEATMHALRHPAYRERYQRNKRRLGKQRGAKIAQVDIRRCQSVLTFTRARSVWPRCAPTSCSTSARCPTTTSRSLACSRNGRGRAAATRPGRRGSGFTGI
jgi:transposase